MVVLLGSGVLGKHKPVPIRVADGELTHAVFGTVDGPLDDLCAVTS